MKFRILAYLLVALVVAVLVSLIYYLKVEGSVPDYSQPIGHHEATGQIDGSLAYIHDSIPKMRICGENIDTQKRYCTQTEIENPKYHLGLGYVLRVPVGKYKVYASLLADTAEFPISYRAYYTDSSHDPQIVEVEIGTKVSNIDPIDWSNN